MLIKDYIKKMEEADLAILYTDGEMLERDGILYEDAPLRQLTKELYGDAGVLKMLTILHFVYKELSKRYINDSRTSEKK